MFYYAQLNEDNKVAGVSQLSGEVNHPLMVRIEIYDEELIGKLYINNEFV
jgi:hypothetical protein